MNSRSIIFDGGNGKALTIMGKLDPSGNKLNIQLVLLFLDKYHYHATSDASGYCDITSGNNMAKYECNVAFSNQNLSITAEGPYVQLK